MTNPPDDTGPRLPPPRQADDAPPLGGPGHAPPQPPLGPPEPGPGQPPPGPGRPPPGWQGPPPPAPPRQVNGPRPDQPIYMPPPPRSGRKSFIGTLFDLSFDESVTVRLAKAIYALIILVDCLGAIIVLWYGVSFYVELSHTLGIVLILMAPVGWLFNLVMARVFMEFVINQFKISEHLKVIRDRGGPR